MDTQNAEEEKQKDNENKIVENGNNNNNKLKKPIFEKDEDYKEFDDLLDVIYSDKNIKSKDVNKREIDKLKTITLNLLKNKKQPFDRFNEYFTIKIKPKIKNENSTNINLKKIKIFEILNEIDYEMQKNLKPRKNSGKNAFFGIFGNNNKNDNLKHFNIKEFREEFNLDEKNYPDKVLKEKYKECNGDKNKMFYQLVVKE